MFIKDPYIEGTGHMILGQAYSGVVDYPLNLRNLRNFLKGWLPETSSLKNFGIVPPPPSQNSVIIHPDPTSFVAIREWLVDRGLLNTRKYVMFGRIAWTTHDVRVDKVVQGMRFTFQDELDAVMFKLTWDLGS